MPLNQGLLEQRRAAYRYPPACVRRHPSPPTPLLPKYPYTVDDPQSSGWSTTPALLPSVRLDAYHHGLLHSACPQDQFDGVLSIVYWGHFAKRTGAHNPYALSRTRWLLKGKRGRRRRTVAFVSRRVTEARNCLAASPPNLRRAIEALDEIAFIGPSFASKILAFMDPQRCAVLDAVILHQLHCSADADLRAITKDAAGFEAWCVRA